MTDKLLRQDRAAVFTVYRRFDRDATGSIVATNKSSQTTTFDNVFVPYDKNATWSLPSSYVNSTNLPATLQLKVGGQTIATVTVGLEPADGGGLPTDREDGDILTVIEGDPAWGPVAEVIKPPTPDIVAFVSGYNNNSNTLTLAVPAGVQPADTIVIYTFSSFGLTSVSTGYSIIQATSDFVGVGLVFKDADGTEGGTNVTLTLNASAEVTGYLMVVRGAKRLDGFAVKSFGGSSLHSIDMAPSGSTPGSRVITGVCFRRGDGTITTTPGSVVQSRTDTGHVSQLSKYQFNGGFYAHTGISLSSNLTATVGAVVISVSG